MLVTGASDIIQNLVVQFPPPAGPFIRYTASSSWGGHLEQVNMDGHIDKPGLDEDWVERPLPLVYSGTTRIEQSTNRRRTELYV